MAVWGVMTIVNSQGEEVIPCGSGSWVRLDGRQARHTLLAQAVEHFLRQKPYRVIIAKGELSAGNILAPVIWSSSRNIHEACRGTIRQRIRAILND